MANCKVASTTTATLTLNENELKALSDVLTRIGGSPVDSIRKYTDQILASIPDPYRHGRYYGDDSAIISPNRAIYYASDKLFD